MVTMFFKASASCSKMLNGKSKFNTVKISGQLCFFRASASFSKLVNGEKTFNTVRVLLRRFRDPVRVPRISNRVLRIRENDHRVPKIKKGVPRNREIGSLQIQTRFLTFFLKKP